LIGSNDVASVVTTHCPGATILFATQLALPEWIRSLDDKPCQRDATAVAPFDAEDLARVLTGFRGQPRRTTSAMRYVRRPADGNSSTYVLDDESAMVYILD
jgi:hypothetical protein